MKPSIDIATATTLGLALVLSACGSKSDGPTVDVPAKCREVENTFCGAAVSCSIAVGEITEADRQANLDACLSEFTVAASCDQQTRIQGDPAVCEHDLATLSCAVYVQGQGLPTPASCKNLFWK